MSLYSGTYYAGLKFQLLEYIGDAKTSRIISLKFNPSYVVIIAVTAGDGFYIAIDWANSKYALAATADFESTDESVHSFVSFFPAANQIDVGAIGQTLNIPTNRLNQRMTLAAYG